MKANEIGQRLLSAGLDTVGSEQAVVDEAVQRFIKRVAAQLRMRHVGLCDVEDLGDIAGMPAKHDLSRIAAAGSLEAWTALLSPGLTPEQTEALRFVAAYLDGSRRRLDRTHAAGLCRVFGLEQQKGAESDG